MRVSNRKRVLVTGAAGFWGTHLCHRLLAEDCDVLCVDNFYSGTKDNIKHLPQDDPRQRQPDIALARSMLDWGPLTRLDKGLGNTIAYFRA